MEQIHDDGLAKLVFPQITLIVFTENEQEYWSEQLQRPGAPDAAGVSEGQTRCEPGNRIDDLLHKHPQLHCLRYSFTLTSSLVKHLSLHTAQTME